MAKNIIIRDLTKSQNEKLEQIQELHNIQTNSGAVKCMLEHYMNVIERNRALEQEVRDIQLNLNYLRDYRMRLDSTRQMYEDQLKKMLNS